MRSSSELELEPLLALIARRMRELVDARLVLIALPDGGESLRVAAAEGERHLRHRRHAPRLRPLEGGSRARARAQRARGLGARGSGDRPAGGATARRSLCALRPARRARAAARRRDRARQGRREPGVQRRRPPARRGPRRARGDGGRACRSGSAATFSAASSRHRSTSESASRASSTTRRARRSPRSCSG